MFSSKFVFATVFCTVSVPSVWAQRLVPITDLGRSADLVVFGAVDQILQAGGGTSQDIVLDLRVVHAMKGGRYLRRFWHQCPRFRRGLQGRSLFLLAC